ncbi:CHAT domain-containing protein [Caballeronia jiangsuensis]|uniref:CHAT domain-containing protein n=1 Tax=Caballeronia jiangsuensis TaxID=1458357 RepID=A0ABW9CVB8_9BURK
MDNETPKHSRVILLLTNRPVNVELIRQRVEELHYLQDSFPDSATFVDLEIEELASIEEARDWFRKKAQTGCEAALVLLDPQVSINRDLQAENRGLTLTGFLDELEIDHPAVPVLIASPAPAEDIQRLAVGRPLTGLWLMGSDDPDDPEGSGDFAEALAGLAVMPPRSAMRYTISVGNEAARYVVLRGNYKIASTTAIDYGTPKAIESVLKRIERFYPDDGGTVSLDNADMIFIDAGNRLYDLLIRKTVGPGIIRAFGGRDMPGPSPVQEKMDLRFEIKVGSTEHSQMFNLPFEFMNDDPDQDANWCFCPRVPMARRLNLGQRALRGSGRPSEFEAQQNYRTLFMACDVDNTVMLRLDADHELRKVTLNYLTNIERERTTLRECGEEGGARRISSLIELGIGTSPSVGVRLRDELKKRLKYGRFDIFHFAGHSIALRGVKDSPFLVLPDEPGFAQAVPIRDVAQWLNEGNCKFMVLASCGSASVVTATETMRGGAEGIVGFRWEVDDAECAEFFERFYHAYFKRGSSLAESFRDACRDEKPIQTQLLQWASAVAVLRD